MEPRTGERQRTQGILGEHWPAGGNEVCTPSGEHNKNKDNQSSYHSRQGQQLARHAPVDAEESGGACRPGDKRVVRLDGPEKRKIDEG